MSVDLNLIAQGVSGTPGTGTITLGAALPGFRALAATVDGITVNGQLLDVLLTDGVNQSVEIDCLYNSTAGTLARGTVESSTTGARLSLTSAAQVRVVAAASRSAAWQNNIGAVAVTGTPTAGQVPVATSATAATWQTPSGGGGSYEVATFANLPAAASATVGRVYTVLAPVCTGGLPGTTWKSDGTVWRPAGNQTVLVSMVNTDLAAISTEQVFAQAAFSAGVLPGVSFVKFRFRLFYAAANGAFQNINTRVGTTGTISDTVIDTSLFTIGNNVRSYSNVAGFCIANATTIRKVHSSPANFESSSSRTDTVGEADATVPSMETNPTFLSISIFLGGGSAVTTTRRYLEVLVE